MKKLFLLILSTSTITISPFATTPARANEAYAEIIKSSSNYIEQGDTSDLTFNNCVTQKSHEIKFYKNERGQKKAWEALRYRPKDLEAHFLIGKSYWNQALIRSCRGSIRFTLADRLMYNAARSFEIAWKEGRTKEAGIWYTRALINVRGGNMVTSIKTLNLILSDFKEQLSSEEQLVVYHNLGLSHEVLLKKTKVPKHQKEHYSKAKMAYQTALRISPGHFKTTNRLQLLERYAAPFTWYSTQ